MEKRHRQMNTNAGFSLIELIVAVVIISVLAGSSFLGVSQILRTNVTYCAEKIVAAFDQARYENLYLEGNVTLQLMYEDEKYYAVVLLKKKNGETTVTEERRREIVGDGKVEIFATTAGGTNVNVAAQPVVIAFKKSSGALEAADEIYKSILVENASKRAEITLVEHTGRCFLDVE